jgi:hypothetical protein
MRLSVFHQFSPKPAGLTSTRMWSETSNAKLELEQGAGCGYHFTSPTERGDERGLRVARAAECRTTSDSEIRSTLMNRPFPTRPGDIVGRHFCKWISTIGEGSKICPIPGGN